jgi:hypothetical protein
MLHVHGPIKTKQSPKIGPGEFKWFYSLSIKDYGRVGADTLFNVFLLCTRMNDNQ